MTGKIEKYSKEELLERIKELEELERVPPKQLDRMEEDKIRRCCVEYIEGLSKKEYQSENHKQYIFESALEAVYGKDVWEWVNKMYE